jgi:hypothetical protein
VTDETLEESILGQERQNPIVVGNQWAGLDDDRAADAEWAGEGLEFLGKDGAVQIGVVGRRPRNAAGTSWVIEVRVCIEDVVRARSALRGQAACDE